ncbi:hypothetical protein [Bacillus thuringiensis]|uniref:hypothetical protein n=1 Tax=Bacillus thuringiensis TaxID=1428 RepID=UPI0012FE4183
MRVAIRKSTAVKSTWILKVIVYTIQQNALRNTLSYILQERLQVNEMNLQQKIESEISILRLLIDRYKRCGDSESICVVIAYEYGLRALIEVYEMSKQKEVMPF